MVPLITATGRELSGSFSADAEREAAALAVCVADGLAVSMSEPLSEQAHKNAAHITNTKLNAFFISIVFSFLNSRDAQGGRALYKRGC